MLSHLQTALVGLYQCVAAVPNAYRVEPPDGLESYSRWISVLEFPADMTNFIIPPACLGTYRRQLLISSCWPIVLLVVAAAGCIGRELMRRGKTRNLVVRRDTRSIVGAGLQQILPLTLVVTFVLLPSTSMVIFKTFLCDAIEYAPGDTRRYLSSDLEISCASDDYKTTQQIAIVMILVWPVGIPVLYALLLWASRDALITGNATPLSRAVAFLSDDYDAMGYGTFWWEPLEMFRKLFLTGFVLVIDESSEQARVLAALLVSITFLALHLAIKPHKKFAAARMDSHFQSHYRTNVASLD